MDIVIKTLTNEEMQVLTASLEIDKASSIRCYQGFSLFNGNKTSSSAQYDHVFFVAYHNEQVVGVLKFSDTRFSEKVWSVSWIDVHKDFRRQGIARQLYQYLNNYVPLDTIVIGTFYVENGEDAQLHDLRKSIVTRVPCFADRQEYWEHQQKENLSHHS